MFVPRILSAPRAGLRPARLLWGFRQPGAAWRCLARTGAVLAVLLSGLPARAEILPPPPVLAARLPAAEAITVDEPHLSGGGPPVLVTYRGWPAEAVLDQVLGAPWRAPGMVIEFRALDGYLSRIPGERFSRQRAYLVTERPGHPAFAVDNPAQNEKAVPLGPYYLVWDNRDDAALRAQGATDWPYQIAEILLSTTRRDALIPDGLPEILHEIVPSLERYCLTCHQVNGHGGGKWPGNLARQARTYERAHFVRWVTAPARVKPGTAMPGLPATLPESERTALAGRLHDYLTTVPLRDPEGALP